MTEFFFEYGLFAAKLVTFVVAVLFVVVASTVVTRRVRKSMKGHIKTKRVNDAVDGMRHAMDAGVSDPCSFKMHAKQRRKEKKKERKARKMALKQAAAGNGDGETAAANKPRVFVLDLDGDLRASAVSRLRREITALLTIARYGDEVVVRLESGGGRVHAYGLASSQLQRVKERGVDLPSASTRSPPVAVT